MVKHTYFLLYICCMCSLIALLVHPLNLSILYISYCNIPDPYFCIRAMCSLAACFHNAECFIILSQVFQLDRKGKEPIRSDGHCGNVPIWTDFSCLIRRLWENSQIIEGFMFRQSQCTDRHKTSVLTCTYSAGALIRRVCKFSVCKFASASSGKENENILDAVLRKTKHEMNTNVTRAKCSVFELLYTFYLFI